MVIFNSDGINLLIGWPEGKYIFRKCLFFHLIFNCGITHKNHQVDKVQYSIWVILEQPLIFNQKTKDKGWIRFDNITYEQHKEDIQLLWYHLRRGQFHLTQTKSILIGIQHQFLQFNPGLEFISTETKRAFKCYFLLSEISIL